jgi:hypothetical protein
MMSAIQKNLAVTLAFFFASIAISGLLYGVARFGVGIEFGHGVSDWGRQTLVLAGDAALAGLAVDLIRFAAARLIPRKA